MAATPTSATEDTTASGIAALLPSWDRSLRARRISPRTIATYTISARQLDAFLAAQGMPRAVAAIRREHVEAFIAGLLESKSPATAHNRYRGCQAFFVWCEEEGEVKTSPMGKMKPPRLPEAPTPVLRERDLEKLLASVDADRTYNGRRDGAIIRLLLDTGIRRAELLGLAPGDIDLDDGLLTVTGKGSRTRRVPMGTDTVRALDRYVRARAKRPDAGEPWLWLGRKGRLQETGLRALLHTRGEAVGLDAIHPHQFRHTYAHMMLDAGFQETDLMAVAGWKSRDMVSRYAAETRAERAIKAARVLSPADRLAEGKR